MAEGVTVSSSDVICRFFATATCRDGDKCEFSHDMSNTVLDKVCRYYLKGRCAYGPKCRYDHVRVKPSIAWTTKKADQFSQSAGFSRNTSASSKQYPVPLKSNISNQTGMLNKSNSNQKLLPSKPNSAVRQKLVPFKNGVVKDALNGPGSPNWVNAPEFVPKTHKSYADVLKTGEEIEYEGFQSQDMSAEELLCPYFVVGDCPYEGSCNYVHGEVCDMCGKACLLPFDEEQQKRHLKICEEELVKDMEVSFAVQRSEDKTCGICFDVIMEKQPPSERRFGILEKCNHVFCLSCIRTWRKARHTEASHSFTSPVDPETTRTCPECRVGSDFVTPSKYWVDSEEEKTKLIKDYKEALNKKPCKYFKQGEGNCPFAGACFYLHAYPDGTKANLPPPKRRQRRDQNGDLDFMERIFLWDFVAFREEVMAPDWDWEDFLYDISDYDSDQSLLD